MERVSTNGLRPAGKAQAWSELYSGVLAAADFIPFDDDFSAGLAMSHVGPLGLARLAAGRCAINRTAAHIDLSPTEYRDRAPAPDREPRRPVAISFDRTGANATLDGAHAGDSVRP